MPLSEHEQRLLDQIERALYAEDPKFASTVRATDLRSVMRRRIRWAVAIFAIGFVLMLFGVKFPVVGIFGFTVMVGAIALALSAWKRLGGAPAGLRVVDGEGQRSPRKAKSRGSARQRLEQRWQRRWDERGGPR